MILGFDPGRDKCGVAVMTDDGGAHTPAPATVANGTNNLGNGSVQFTDKAAANIMFADVVAADEAIATVLSLTQTYPVSLMVMGDQTMAKQWKSTFEPLVSIPIVLVDERYSTLEARDRYWTLYPPKGLTRLIPKALRSIPRPIDDVVAIILIERYWQMSTPHPQSG